MLDDLRTRRVLRGLAFLFIGLVATAVIAIVLARVGPGAGQVGIGLIILQSAFLVGALLGFLFSLPRVLARGNPTPDAYADQVGATAGARRLLQTNSNLERVSDWLTTLLIGIALADLSQLNDQLGNFRDFVAEFSGPCVEAAQRLGQASAPSPVVAASTAAEAVANCSLLPALAPMLLIVGAVLGFLAMYLYTRIVIARLFEDVESGLGREEQRAVVGTAQASAAVDTDTPAAALLAATLRPGPVSVEDSLDVMLAQLYQTASAGYERAIELGNVLATTAAANRADYWLYLSAAWGQKHAALLPQGNADAIAGARDNAVRAAARTIEINPAYRERLAALAKADPANAAADNDLATLVDDPELRRLLRLDVTQ